MLAGGKDPGDGQAKAGVARLAPPTAQPGERLENSRPFFAWNAGPLVRHADRNVVTPAVRHGPDEQTDRAPVR